MIATVDAEREDWSFSYSFYGLPPSHSGPLAAGNGKEGGDCVQQSLEREGFQESKLLALPHLERNEIELAVGDTLLSCNLFLSNLPLDVMRATKSSEQ